MEAGQVAALIYLDASLALAATGLALWVRPWRSLSETGPPWPWLLMWALTPLFWGLDRYAATPLAQPVSGVALLTLMAGWPLAILSLWPASLVVMLAGDLAPSEALHRLVWLGVAPATVTLLIGAGLRRWLPHQVFVYILGRGFFGTFVAVVLASWVALCLQLTPVASEFYIARLLGAFGEAFITGMFAAILVALRPQWLATYADRIYLKPPA